MLLNCNFSNNKNKTKIKFKIIYKLLARDKILINYLKLLNLNQYNKILDKIRVKYKL